MTKKTTTTALPVDPVAEAERRLAAAEREIADIEARQKRLADLQRQSAELRASLMDARAAAQAAGTVDAATDQEAAEKLKAARLEGARLALELEDTDAAAARAIQRRQEAAAAAEKERKAARIAEARTAWAKRVALAKAVDDRLAELADAVQAYKQAGVSLCSQFSDVVNAAGHGNDVIMARYRIEMSVVRFNDILAEAFGISWKLRQHAAPLAETESSIMNNALGSAENKAGIAPASAPTAAPAAPDGDSKPVVATTPRPVPVTPVPVVPVDLADDDDDRTVFEVR